METTFKFLQRHGMSLQVQVPVVVWLQHPMDPRQRLKCVNSVNPDVHEATSDPTFAKMGAHLVRMHGKLWIKFLLENGYTDRPFHEYWIPQPDTPFLNAFNLKGKFPLYEIKVAKKASRGSQFF